MSKAGKSRKKKKRNTLKSFGKPFGEKEQTRSKSRLGAEKEIEGCGETQLPLTADLADQNGGAEIPSFQVPQSIVAALDRCPTLGSRAELRRTAFWQAQIRAKPGVDFAQSLLDAEAWLVENPDRGPRQRFSAFMGRWFKREQEKGR